MRTLKSKQLHLKVKPYIALSDSQLTGRCCRHSTLWCVASFSVGLDSFWYRTINHRQACCLFQRVICSHPQSNLAFNIIKSRSGYILLTKILWLRGVDSNHRPSAYEADELPTALPRYVHQALAFLISSKLSHSNCCMCLLNLFIYYMFSKNLI